MIWTYFEAMGRTNAENAMGLSCDRIEVCFVLPTMGSDVTVVEVLPQILPLRTRGSPPARASVLRNRASRSEQYQVTRLRRRANSVVATIDDGKAKASDDRIRSGEFPLGVSEQNRNLGLEKLGVKNDRGVVVIDGRQDNVPASMPWRRSRG